MHSHSLPLKLDGLPVPFSYPASLSNSAASSPGPRLPSSSTEQDETTPKTSRLARIRSMGSLSSLNAPSALSSTLLLPSERQNIEAKLERWELANASSFEQAHAGDWEDASHFGRQRAISMDSLASDTSFCFSDVSDSTVHSSGISVTENAFPLSNFVNTTGIEIELPREYNQCYDYPVYSGPLPAYIDATPFPLPPRLQALQQDEMQYHPVETPYLPFSHPHIASNGNIYSSSWTPTRPPFYRPVRVMGPSPNNKKAQLYKTEMCRSFLEIGSCRYEEKCQFAHGMEELRPLSRYSRPASIESGPLCCQGHCSLYMVPECAIMRAIRADAATAPPPLSTTFVHYQYQPIMA